MVQQLKEKFKEYTWMHNGSTTPTKMTNTCNNSMSNSVESSLVTKEKGQDIVAKRKEPDSSFSSFNINKASNKHIVYVRRKNISHVSDSSSIKSAEANKETEPPKVHVEKTQGCNNVGTHAPEINGELSHNHSGRCTEPKNPEIPSKLETEVLKVHLEKREDCNKKCTTLHEKNNVVSNDNSINCTESKNPQYQNKIETEMHEVHLEKREDCNKEFTRLHGRNNEMSHDNIADGIKPNDHQNPINLETEMLKVHLKKSQECSNAISYTHKKSSDISHVHTVQIGEAYNPLKPCNVEQNTSADRLKISNINVDCKKTSINSDQNYPSRSIGSKSQAGVERSNGLQNWEERYRNLQIFLNKCDQSSQEDRITMLRSLTAAERSRHALELEKRALHLLLEEGKELSRMQVLNVLGQPTSTENHSSPSVQFEANYSQISPYLRNKQ